ncbi:MAG: hypothetical protein ABSE73_15030 [Planctomycetota bacterium]
MKKTMPLDYDDNLERCLAARRRIERRCKTFEGLCAYLERLEERPFPTPKMLRLAAQAKLEPIRASATALAQAQMTRRGKAQARKQARLPARNGRPANGKPVHKA